MISILIPKLKRNFVGQDSLQVSSDLHGIFHVIRVPADDYFCNQEYGKYVHKVIIPVMDKNVSFHLRLFVILGKTL